MSCRNLLPEGLYSFAELGTKAGSTGSVHRGTLRTLPALSNDVMRKNTAPQEAGSRRVRIFMPRVTY